MNTSSVKIQTNNPHVVNSILDELRLLRTEVMMPFPQENIEDYAHPKKIKKSYQKAKDKY